MCCTCGETSLLRFRSYSEKRITFYKARKTAKNVITLGLTLLTSFFTKEGVDNRAEKVITRTCYQVRAQLNDG